MAADKGPFLIEVHDRSVINLLAAADWSLRKFEELRTSLEDETTAASLDPLMNTLKSAMRQMRDDMDPRAVK